MLQQAPVVGWVGDPRSLCPNMLEKCAWCLEHKVCAWRTGAPEGRHRPLWCCGGHEPPLLAAWGTGVVCLPGAWACVLNASLACTSCGGGHLPVWGRCCPLWLCPWCRACRVLCSPPGLLSQVRHCHLKMVELGQDRVEQMGVVCDRGGDVCQTCRVSPGRLLLSRVGVVNALELCGEVRV